MARADKSSCVGDVIQLIGVAPGEQGAGPESTLQLADRLEVKAKD